MRPGEAREDSIARNAAFSLASQLTTAALTAVLVLFLVRVLEPAEYGLFAIGLGLNSIALLVADFGISASTARFLAEQRADRARLGTTLMDAFKLKLLVSAAACVLLALLAAPIANAYGEPRLAWVVRGMALATFGQSLMLLSFEAFNALALIRVRYRVVVLESATEVSASILLVLLAGGASAAAFGRAIGYAVGAVFGIATALRVVGLPRLGARRLPGRETVARVGGYARSLFVVDAAYHLSASANILLIGAYLGSAASGIYSAPMRLIVLLQYPGLSLANAVAPRLARGRGQAPNVAGFTRGLRGLIVFQAATLAPAVVWAQPISDVLLGSGYEQSADVLAALAPYLFLSGLAALVSVAVNYLGEARRRIPIAVASLAVLVVAAMALIPSRGVVGAAIAADLSAAVYVGAHLLLCRRLLGFPLAPLGATLARALLAAAAMALALAAAGTGDLGAGELVGGAAGGLLAFAAVLVVTGETSLRAVLQLPVALRARLRPQG